jgi:hypothetical protein
MIIHLIPLIFATFFMTAKLISNCLFHFFGSCCHYRFLFVGARPLFYFTRYPPPSPALSSSNTPCVLLSV